jgi:GAF domain/ANTAR domain
VSTDSQASVRDWGQLMAFVVGPGDQRDDQAALALAVSLGATITSDATACSVTQVNSSGFRTPAWSDRVALDLDEAQYACGDGPCVAAARDGQRHAIAVMADERRYPVFTSAAMEHGVRCSLSIPLSTREIPGALNLYARATSAYDSEPTRSTAELLARCVGLLLDDRPVRPNPGLAAALERRALIKRAQDELVRQGMSHETDAYVRMTQLSRRDNRSIFAVAADLVGEGSGPGPDARQGEPS